MKYRNGLAFSTIALAILTTGCVKKPENGSQVVYDHSQVQGGYDSTTYDTSATSGGVSDTSIYNPTAQTGTTYDPSEATYDPNITYDNTVATTSGSIYTGEATDNTAITTSGSIYTGEATDATQITTADTYGQAVASNNGAFNNSSSSSSAAASEDNYPDPYASEDTYPDPYASKSPSNGNYSYPTNNTTSGGTSSHHTSGTSSSRAGRAGGISLQIAALTDYYAAETFKNSLSLDPKYSAYVKKGHPNKVIVTGISSRTEANRLKERRFPGAFIVSGGSSYSSSSASSSSSSSSSSAAYAVDNGYTTNTSYGTSGATSGFGVQVGAFSTRAKAQNAAESASSKYTPLIKKVRRNGKTLYKAILTGFSSESAARRFIAKRGSGFFVQGL